MGQFAGHVRGARILTLVGAIAVLSRVSAAQHSCTPDQSHNLRARLPALMDSAQIPGIALALIHKGHVVWTGGFGRADSTGHRISPTRTIFEAASLSKPVVAYAALRLVDQGKLDLDRPLLDYTPYPDFRGDPRARLISARMVLAHTTGLQNERIGNDSLTFSFTPGTRFQYSGEGYLFLARVMEVVTASPLPEVMKQLVFDPLGMKRSSFIWESSFEDDAAIGYGRFAELRRPTRPRTARAPSSLHTTAADYARFMVAIASGVGLKPATWRAMQTPVIPVAPNVSWGLGWAIEQGSGGRALAQHGDNSNSGFTSLAMIDVRRKCGLVYLTNSTNGLSIIREIAAAIPGNHPGVELLPYERYNTPGALARRDLARTLRSAGVDSAVALYRTMKADAPARAPEGLLNDLGYSLLNTGRAAESIVVFEENARQFPSSGNVYDSLGDAYLTARKPIEARKAFEHAWSLDPRNSRARHLADSLGAIR